MPPSTDKDRLNSPTTELLECVGCGYDLRGLGLDDLCPECALPVVRSKDGNRLKGRDSKWVAGLQRGLNWTLIGVFVAIVADIVIGLAHPVARVVGADLGLVTGAAMILSSLLMIPLIAGVWLLTQPDPGRQQNERPLSVRRIARGSMILQALIVPAGALGVSVQQVIRLNVSGTMTGNGLPTPANVTSLISLAMLLAIIAGIAHLAGIAWMRSLVLALPHRSLAKQLRWCFRLKLVGTILKVVMLTSALVIVPIVLRQVAENASIDVATMIPAGIFLGLGVLGALLGAIAVVWLIVILFVLRKPFRLAASAGAHDAPDPPPNDAGDSDRAGDSDPSTVV